MHVAKAISSIFYTTYIVCVGVLIMVLMDWCNIFLPIHVLLAIGVHLLTLQPDCQDDTLPPTPRSHQ